MIRFIKRGRNSRKNFLYADTLICLRIFQYILLIQKADLVLDVHRIHHVFCFNKAGHSIRKKCIFLHFFLRISVIFCTFSKSIVSAKGHLKKLQLFFFS